jgi:hypothetical protein
VADHLVKYWGKFKFSPQGLRITIFAISKKLKELNSNLTVIFKLEGKK